MSYGTRLADLALTSVTRDERRGGQRRDGALVVTQAVNGSSEERSSDSMR
jgi:hypothetical protein